MRQAGPLRLLRRLVRALVGAAVRPVVRALACAPLIALAAPRAPAWALDPAVSLSGRMGERALLIVNGTPRTVATGQTVQGVKVLSVGPDSATVEVGGQRLLLTMGSAPVNLGGGPSANRGTQVVLAAGSGGHFVSAGSINGKAVRFVVDTGASLVSLSQAEADRIGLKYKDGPRGFANTANGQVPVHRALLQSVRLGDVQIYDVEAMVVPASMDLVLLGNSFLSRFQMKRENDTLTLDKKP